MQRFILLLLLAAVCGCSDRVRVTGRVTFSDGSPLTVGEVRFVNDKMVFSGTLKQDGSYELGSGGSANGIVLGKYNVSIEYAGVPGETKPGQMYPEQIPLVAAKYADYATSGISCEVKGSMTFNITVEKP